MAKRTATTANAILGLLALRKEWSTWELTTQLRRNLRFFWPRAESQIYAEVKTLVGRGWARDRQTFVGRRARTNYTITAAGRPRADRVAGNAAEADCTRVRTAPTRVTRGVQHTRTTHRCP